MSGDHNMYCSANNKQEPVAWMYVVNETWSELSAIKPPDDAYDEGTLTPLYTEPQYRELSDKEINECWKESHEDGIAMQQRFTTQQHYFAYLILKKASEK